MNKFKLIILIFLIYFTACGGGGSSGGSDGTESKPATYTISGKVTLDGSGLEGITITLSGNSSGTKTTDENGNYSFSSLSSGSYTLTPSSTYSNYLFNPIANEVTISSSNANGIDFTAFEKAAVGVVGPDGGNIEVLDPASPLFGVRLEIFQGTLNEDTTISIAEPVIYPPIPNGYNLGDIPIELEPSGLIFNEYVKLMIPSDGTTERLYFTYDVEEGAWNVVDTIFDSSSNNYEILTSHFSIFGWLHRWLVEYDKFPFFEPCSTVTYKFEHITEENASNSTQEEIKEAIRNAFRKWQQAMGCRIFFKEELKEDNADISIMFTKSNKWSKYKDAAAYCGVDWSGKTHIQFNDTGAFTWSAGGPYCCPAICVESYVLHEIGHALGLSHKCLDGSTDCLCSENKEYVMAPRQRKCFEECFKLHEGDINRAIALYECDNKLPCDIPVLISPHTDELLDNGRTDGYDTIVWDFDWMDVHGACKYHLYVIGGNAFIPIINDQEILESSFHHLSNGYISNFNLLRWKWKVRAFISGRWCDWSEERTFDVERLNTDRGGVNKYPQLSNENLFPRSGDTSTLFTWVIDYIDGDFENPITTNVYIDGWPQEMILNSGVGPYWGTYVFQTSLSQGTHYYFYRFKDPKGAEIRLPSTGSYVGPTVDGNENHSPQLSFGDVNPISGDSSTTFTYSVYYYDLDGDSPSSRYAYIDGIPYSMSLYSGDSSNGQYQYQTALSSSSDHNYYFHFTDGQGGSTRLPPSGEYSGPSISIEEEPSITIHSATITGIDTSAKSLGDTTSVTTSITYSISNAQLSGGNYGVIHVLYQHHKYQLPEEIYAWPNGASGEISETKYLTSPSGTLEFTITDKGNTAYLSDKIRLYLYFAAAGGSVWNSYITNVLNITH